MGRKLFIRHLDEVSASPPQGLSAIHSPDEGIAAFTFSYARSGQAPRSCELKLLAMDVGEYPDGNTYMLFTDDDTADRNVTSNLEVITAVLMGRPLTEALAEISQSLRVGVTSGQVDNPIDLGSPSSADENKNDDESDDGFVEYDSDDENFGLAISQTHGPASKEPGLASKTGSRTSLNTSVPLPKIKSDLRAAKDAGFRVGVHGDLTTGGIVSISVRVTKLGVSEEAMQAWGLRRSHYFVLMIRFLHGYRDLTQIREDSALTGLTEMRAVLCDHYKPSRADALEAFGQVPATTSNTISSNSAPIESLFIASALNDLLRDRFPKIVKFRESCGFNWPSAEAFVNEVQGKAVSAVDNLMVDEYYLPDDTEGKVLPEIVKADTIDGKILKNVSLPLAAMQFALRHFVRCTEFCLVCHCKVENTFEALKPYVCSRPLCLYQYMALGFGPSLEWEILSQPYVVDLLVSFCYAAAKQGRLKELPVGIDLKVPMLPHYKTVLSYNRYGGYHASGQAPGSSSWDSFKPTFSATIRFDQKELLLDSEQKALTSSLRKGDWVAVYSKDKGALFHYRVEEAMFPTYSLSDPVKTKLAAPPDFVHAPGSSASSSTRPSTPPKVVPPGSDWVQCHCYNSSFDMITSNEQHHAILLLLETLPSTLDMQQYLQGQTGQEPSLKMWRSRISDPALQLLRWVVASNRSCIVQVDRLAHGKPNLSKNDSLSDDRVLGMEQWMQFRFAQGAPDKEQRFIDSVNNQSASKQYPTFFAWHGSPIGNWHSIIRQGLRYDETLHGRAFGNGVYMAPQASTSMSYSHGEIGTWPNSTLKISNALSLQEVANVPEKFVSRSPHYVVADIDWIQTRYLFVQSTLDHTAVDWAQFGKEYAQDPTMVASNETGKAIKIPITAVSKSRRPAVGHKSTTIGNKKSKGTTVIDQATVEQQEDDANSIVSDMEDLALLSADDDDFDDMSLDEDYLGTTVSHSPAAVSPGTSQKRALDTEETDFRPGSLDVTKIKFLPPPSDATTSATKALMGAFKEAVRTQEKTPLHKLGWYINPDSMENVYQWIVELHSFNEALPLAQDMKKAGLTSIVLEMRFTNQYPFSPPFIRVVQPRFLPFSQGGGGHVTEGGAICMELLTNTGWSAVTSMESVLLQVQLAMSDEERPARLMSGNRGYAAGRGDSYGVAEAVAAYERACRAHGWQIPDGFSKFALS